MRLLQDDSERMRFFAALALGSLQHRDAVEPIVAMLRDNNGMAALRLLHRREFEELPKIIDVLLTSDNANLRAEARNLLAVAQCIRCHTVNGRGGTAGPDLSAVAHPVRNVDRRYLLESLVLPNAKIAKGFGTVTLVLDTGRLVAGTIKDEDATSLTLVTPSNETMRIARNTIDEQSATTSAMPAMTRALALLEIRDLTEYLSTLTTRSEPK